MRLELVLVSLLVACRSQPDPSAASPVPTASAPAPKRICEATVMCGMWSKCAWLEVDRVEASHEVYRLDGVQYARWHHCWPEDAGRNGCSLYCDLGGTCVDALSAKTTCTASAAPRPSPYVCEVRGADCVTLP